MVKFLPPSQLIDIVFLHKVNTNFREIPFINTLSITNELWHSVVLELGVSP